MMKINKKLKEGIKKKIALFSLVALLLNTAMAGIFVPSKNLLQASNPPRIDVEKQAVPVGECGIAEITLTITGAGDPIEERKPIDVVFVIDRSASMEGVYLTNVKTAVKNFIDEMDFSGGDPDKVAVVSYAGYKSDPSQINYALGSDGIAAKSAVDGLIASGGTCIECGLNTAYGMLNSGDREQFVILLSDGVANVKMPGDDNASNVCFYAPNQANCPVSVTTCINNAIAQGSSIKSLGVPIYSIGYRLEDISPPCPAATENLAIQTLQDISSGVDYYYNGGPSSIGAVFNEIAYEINNVAGYDAKIIEVLPAGINYTGMVSGPNSDSILGQTITWEFGNLAIGDSREVVFSVAMDGLLGYQGLIDVYPDTRAEYKDYEDTLYLVPFPETNIDIASCVVPYCGDGNVDPGEECDDGNDIDDDDCSNDCLINEEEPYCELELTKTDSQDPVEPGDEITYTLTLTNIGTADCTGSGVAIGDLFDERTTYVEDSAVPELFNMVNNYLEWNFEKIVPSETVEVEFSVLVPEDIECDTVLLNQARFYSDETGWGTYVEETTTVVCEQEPYCELQLTKETINQDSVNPGDELVYYLTLTNTGTANCTGDGVRMGDLFDENTAYVSAVPEPLTMIDNYLEWAFGVLEPNDTREVILTMEVSENAACCSTLVNKAKYYSDETLWSEYVEKETSVVCDLIDPQCIDNDNDGYGTGDTTNCLYQGEDCNDNDASVYPGAAEVCDDGVDNDCDMTTDCDDRDCDSDPSCENGNPTAPASGDIIINELMWMGSSTSGSDEWIELRNMTDAEIDLSNCQLTKKLSSSGLETLMLEIPNGDMISTEGLYLISNYSHDDASSNLNIEPDLVNTAVGLNNSKLQIKLYCGGDWDNGGILVDTADDGIGSPLSGEYTSDSVWKSMTRKNIPGSGELADNWCVASTFVNWDAGRLEFGTPGAPNYCEGECVDNDGDGYGTGDTTNCSYQGEDCNDDDASINPGAVEVCGNSVDEDCDGADTSCSSLSSASAGGGGGFVGGLAISNESIKITESEVNIIITWTTSQFSTSQVIYDTEPGKFDLSAGAPNYGYAYSKEGDDSGIEKVTGHVVTLSGLNPAMTYYYRTVSSASPPVFGPEKSFVTLAMAETEGISEGNNGTVAGTSTEAEFQEGQTVDEVIQEVVSDLTGFAGKTATAQEVQEVEDEAEEEKETIETECEECEECEECVCPSQETTIGIGSTDEETAVASDNYFNWITVILVLIILALLYYIYSLRKTEQGNIR